LAQPGRDLGVGLRETLVEQEAALHSPRVRADSIARGV
jgi:hypothetical protein